ncbi:hypothetical protein LX83_005230 [Goodfellowiella coeruleoviolacea]|uniref:Lipoprotein n=2 Tax=Goodfellowiella coeruleoviolacea TaxID=334858 RepID=A0AAE3KIU1_9PSEU|nr:hypothetical protein [Goodfellowiella coeruleoviolacea]
MATVVGAGLLLVVASACAPSERDSVAAGSGSGGSGTVLTTSPNPPSSSADPSTSDQVVPNGGTAVPGDRVDATALPEGYPVQVWTEGDGTTVGVTGQEGGCGKVRAEVTGQSAAAVAIDLVETVPAGEQLCTMDLRYPPLSVRIDQPLGERTVVLTERTEQK